jgi:Ni/Fe-hydrogenase subunit HybB-like protein
VKVVKTYQKDCALYWDLYIIYIYNVFILSDYCVIVKNELAATFTSLGIEVTECSVLSRIIDRVPVNSVELH